MLHKIHSLIIILLLFSESFFSQQNRLDSLKKELQSEQIDSVKCKLLSNIIDEENDDEWPKYMESLFKIASSHININSQLKTKSDSVFYTFLLVAHDLKGFHNQIIGKTKEAIEYLNKSLQMADRLNNKVASINTLNNLAGIYLELKDTKIAMDFFKKAYLLAKASKQDYYIGKTASNIAICYDNLKDTINTLKYYKEALNAFIASKDIRGESLIYNNLGSFYSDIDPKLASQYFKKGYEITKVINDKRGMAYLAGNISSMALQSKNLNEASKYGLEAFNLAKEIGNPGTIKTQSQNMYKIETEKKNYKEAIEYLKLFYKMRDSINNTNNIKEAMNQKLSYEYKMKKALDDAENIKTLAMSKQRENNQKIISISIGLGLLLVFIFSIFTLKKLKETRKQKKIIEFQKAEVDLSKNIIEEKQKEILDSINYAKRIQYTLLAHDEFLKENLPNHFVYFQPKDIVSGDFYWATKKADKFYLAVCDSTGHGVPGAFMSLLNISFLQEAINEKNIEEPGEVLDFVRERLITNISKEGQKDGFDGILICINQSNNSISYAAANNKPVLIRSGNFHELEADRMPVGSGEVNRNFKTNHIEIHKGDMLFLYTDGMADQFGGPHGKKFKYKQLNQLLLTFSTTMPEGQKNILVNTFNNWKGNLEQIDDVCVLGLTF
jgi:serine phosphatase RsbU (regulator of sigma subunit)/uncharacterized protein YoxC